MCDYYYIENDIAASGGLHAHHCLKAIRRFAEPLMTVLHISFTYHFH